jgi:hypothetical protein
MVKAVKKRSHKKKAGGARVELGAKFKKELPVKINEKACERKRIRVIKAMTERNAEIEKMKPFRLKAKALAEEINKLHDEIEASVEDRPVECVLEYDYEHREVRTRRLDTNSIVKELSRTMTDEDRQEDLLDKKTTKRVADGEPAKTPAEATALARGERLSDLDLDAEADEVTRSEH